MNNIRKNPKLVSVTSQMTFIWLKLHTFKDKSQRDKDLDSKL